MINLRNDYCGICHPKILEKLVEYQSKTFVGYGLDEISDKAKDIIREKINQKDAAIYILPGGTVTNKVMIAHSLAPYEAVISADTGHVNVHETGAIEETGHKVIAMPNYRGKLKAIDVEKAVLSHPDWHMVKPKMVYISNPTEYGTVYTYQELKELSEMCKKYNLYFYSDGARFASALTSKYADYNIKEFAELFDAFYIGGTKNGLLCGEALVVINKKLQENILEACKLKDSLMVFNLWKCLKMIYSMKLVESKMNLQKN